MPESSAMRRSWGERPVTATRPFQSAAMRTRPRISPMPEESMNGTSEKSSRRTFGLTFFAVLSISSRRPAAAWWSRSPRIAAVITPFFNSIRRFILSSFLFFWGGARSVRTAFAFGECPAAQRRAAARTRRLLKSKTENKKDGPL